MRKSLSSNIMLFILIAIYSTNTAGISVTSLIMQNTGKSAWMIPLIVLPIAIILILFYKPLTKAQKVKLKSNKLFRTIFIIYAFLSIVILIFYSSVIISTWFYDKTSIYVFIIASSLLIAGLSLFTNNTLIKTGIILSVSFIATIAITIETVLRHDFSLLLPIDYPNMEFVASNIFSILILLMILLDGFIYVLCDENFQKPLSRKVLIYSVLFIAFHVIIQIVDNYVMFNYQYFDNIFLPSIQRYFMHGGKRYIDHFDIILLSLLMVTLLYKGSLYLILCKGLFPKKMGITMAIMTAFFAICGCIILIKDQKIIKPLFIVAACTIILIYIIIVSYQFIKKENENGLVSKTN